MIFILPIRESLFSWRLQCGIDYAGNLCLDINLLNCSNSSLFENYFCRFYYWFQELCSFRLISAFSSRLAQWKLMANKLNRLLVLWNYIVFTWSVWDNCFFIDLLIIKSEIMWITRKCKKYSSKYGSWSYHATCPCSLQALDSGSVCIWILGWASYGPRCFKKAWS